MHRNRQRWLLSAAWIVAATAAAAQDRPGAAPPPDPIDPQAVVPPVVYRSTLGGLRRQLDDAPVPWQVANDTVGRIGGWRAYAREAAQPASPTAPGTGAPAHVVAPARAPAASAPGRPLPATTPPRSSEGRR